MNILELRTVLKAHGLHVYTDTGGIYTFMGKHFIGSVSDVHRSKAPVTINAIRLNTNHVRTHPEYVNALRTVCAINGIRVIGLD